MAPRRTGSFRPRTCSSASFAASTMKHCCTPRDQKARIDGRTYENWWPAPPIGPRWCQPTMRMTRVLSAVDKEQGQEEGVTLMTLHTAKGLEWPVVVLSGLEHGLFPLARSEEQPGGLEEERRLCYVGLTRAKDKLYLTWARARRRGGELRPGIASRFLKAIPPGIVEERRTTSLWAPDWRGSQAPRQPSWQS